MPDGTVSVTPKRNEPVAFHFWLISWSIRATPNCSFVVSGEGTLNPAVFTPSPDPKLFGKGMLAHSAWITGLMPRLRGSNPLGAIVSPAFGSPGNPPGSTTGNGFRLT